MAYGTGGCVKKRTKKVNKGQTEKKAPGKNSIHHEDLALKTAAQYFGEELMPLLGIKGVAGYIAPTETVILEARQMYQDFNYVMTDAAWIHLEFESDAVTKEDLERFREYEAAVSRANHVEVITYVICSAKIRHPRSVLRTGINLYRVKTVQLKGKNADRLFRRLKEKAEQGEELTKADLVPLLLTPLMSGSLRIEERIIKSLSIIQKAGKVLTELELNKMQAVLYTLADKFLTETELDRVKEMIAMTKLGEMLVEDGIRKGMERGIEKGIVETCRELGVSFDETVLKIKQRFCISETDAREIVRKYWL